MVSIRYAWRSYPIFILTTVGVALFSDLFLFALIVPILPFILDERVHVPPPQLQQTISALLTAFSSASVLLSPIVGWAGDKVPSKRTLYLFSVGILAVATALLFTARNIPLLIVARVFQGASASVVWVMGMALCCDTVAPENLGKAIGTLISFAMLGPLLAHPLSGVLYQLAGINAVAGAAATMLFLDLVLRLLVIVKPLRKGDSPSVEATDQQTIHQAHQTDEQTPLIVTNGQTNPFNISTRRNILFDRVPVLYCLTSRSMLVSLAVIFAEAVFFSSFSATVPLHAREAFKFDPLRAGFMMMPIGLVTLIIGPVAGWAVDRYGTKPLAVAGFGVLVLGLNMMCLVSSTGSSEEVPVYASALGICGVGLALLDSPAIVESMILVKRFHEANPGLFDARGPYAQHNAVVFTFFSLGMSVGPEVAGGLKYILGYGNMLLVLSGFAGIMAVVSLIWLDGSGSNPNVG